MGEALKASIKMLGSVEIPGQLKSLHWTNSLFSMVAPSRGLAVMHSRYPKETEAALRQLGFKDVADPEYGLAGPGALLDTAGIYVAPTLAVISTGHETWEVKMARDERRGQVLNWLAGKKPYATKGDENLENSTRAWKVWDKTFQAEREAFQALGPNYWDKKNYPEKYKAYQDLVKGVMDGDVILAQAGLYGPPSAPSTPPEQAQKGTAKPTTPAAPAGQQKAPTVAPSQDNRNTTATPRASLDSMDDHGLRPGTPEFAAEKQRRLDEWRKVKLGIPAPNQ